MSDAARLDDPSKEPWPRWRRPSISNRVVKTTRLEDASQLAGHYRIDREPIGKGSFGVVHHGHNLSNHQEVAIKFVVKAEAGTRAVEMMENELTILKKVEHPHIVCLHEVFETSQQTMMVLEFCGAGDLETVLKGKVRLKCEEVKTVITRLSSAVGYMHENGMVHRDLKLENILIKQTEDDPWDIKVTDFGLSCMVHGSGTNPDNLMQSYCGTPMYMAPEVLSSFRTYTRQCDVWSMGVIMYRLLSGVAPFKATSIEDLSKEIARKRIDTSAVAWKSVDEDAKKLLLLMLEVSPANRIAAKEVSTHPWVTGRAGEYVGNVLQMMKEMNENMRLSETPDGTSDEVAAMAAGIDVVVDKPPSNPDDRPRKRYKSPPPPKQYEKSKSTSSLSANGVQRPNSAKKSPSGSPLPSYMQPTKSSSASSLTKQRLSQASRTSTAAKRS